MQDFGSAVGGHDAGLRFIMTLNGWLSGLDFCLVCFPGFLIVDDNVDFDEGENEEPDTEEAQSTENSGWSTRSK